jgi:hypothetical protein
MVSIIIHHSIEMSSRTHLFKPSASIWSAEETRKMAISYMDIQAEPQVVAVMEKIADALRADANAKFVKVPKAELNPQAIQRLWGLDYRVISELEEFKIDWEIIPDPPRRWERD